MTKIIGKILVKIPFKVQHIIIDTLLGIMLLDTIISSIRYSGIF